MATHVVMWNFRPEIKAEEKAELLSAMKEGLEGLSGKVPGLISVRFVEKPLMGSTHEMALITAHERAEDIAVYASHPEHVAVADSRVRPYTCDRVCLNFV